MLQKGLSIQRSLAAHPKFVPVHGPCVAFICIYNCGVWCLWRLLPVISFVCIHTIIVCLAKKFFLFPSPLSLSCPLSWFCNFPWFLHFVYFLPSCQFLCGIVWTCFCMFVHARSFFRFVALCYFCCCCCWWCFCGLWFMGSNSWEKWEIVPLCVFVFIVVFVLFWWLFWWSGGGFLISN